MASSGSDGTESSAPTKKSVEIYYDDEFDTIVDKINRLLKEFDLKIELDNAQHEGFEVLSIVEKVVPV